MNRHERRAKMAATLKVQQHTTVPRPEQRRRLLYLYDKVATATASVHQKYEVSCQKGCSHCCNMLVEMTPAEAEYIVDAQPEAVEAALPRLRDTLEHIERHERQLRQSGLRHASLMEFDSAMNKAWWPEQRACPMLVDGLCSIYETRPMPCRNHYVLSNPSQCAGPEAKETIKVQPINGGQLGMVMSQLQGGEIDKIYKYLPRALFAAWERRKK